ncbi:MAG: peroxide stress protein YaaA [Bacteroidales bacterium]
MLIILGPAKTIDPSPHGIDVSHTHPAHTDHACELVDILRTLSPEQLKHLMKVSDKLAHATFESLARWRPDPEPAEGTEAILAFAGEVFNGLQARKLAKEDLQFAQDRVRILSGLYGVLRPLDLILPYRLEMGTALSSSRGRNLYEFWKDVIPAHIARETGLRKPPVLINLASQEYLRSIDPRSFPHRIITPVFRESDGKTHRNVTIYAKKARGMMLSFLLRNRITEPEYLKAFDMEGYAFQPLSSSGEEWHYYR